MSVPEAIYHSVCLAVEPARRTGFYENVVLAGGCSELRGTFSDMLYLVN